MKSEPEVFSWQDLANKPHKTSVWDGVRNYQARNFIRDVMSVNDEIFFYHSSCKTPGIVGIAKVVSKAYPDITALNPQSPYFDPKSAVDNARWFVVDVQLVRSFARFISLDELRQNQENLKNFPLLTRGNRLSVIPVTYENWQFILHLENTKLGTNL